MKSIDRALKALKCKTTMCDLLADCRTYGVPGYWSGSAYRKQPVGLVKGTIKFTNDWMVSDSCDIQITDGEGWDVLNVCRDSWGGGNPHPTPINGEAISVWESGRWRTEEFQEKLEDRILDILAEAAEHIKKAADALSAERREEDRRRIEKYEVAVELAVAKAQGKEL